MNRPPITSTGAERLRTELERLKTEERPRITQAIAEAREHGDLKENAEYHAAREEQGFCEGRIQDLESTLSKAQVIDVLAVGNNAAGRVVFGATIEIEDLDSEEVQRYQIVGDAEADIKQGRLAISSPIAKALIGKEEGDVATVKVPNGLREFEILSVEYVA